MHRAAVVLVAALALAGCAAPSADSGGRVAAQTMGDCSDCDQLPQQTAAAPTEGPAADAHQWPDGVAARVVSITRAPADLGVGPRNPAFDAGLLVTVRFTNDGNRTLTWGSDSATADWTLLYGANRYRAEAHADPDSPLPTRLLPGTSAQWTTVEFLPSAELGRLALQVTPRWNDPAHQPWTFTGVDKLLHG